MFLFEARVVDENFEHKAIGLCFGQRVGAFLFDGVLGGQHKEGVGQRHGVVADGDLSLLHGLQQGTLHFGRRNQPRAGQDEVGENRTSAYIEGIVFATIDQCAHHIGRKEVGGELNAPEIGVDERSERADGKGLGQSRYTFE